MPDDLAKTRGDDPEEMLLDHQRWERQKAELGEQDDDWSASEDVVRAMNEAGRGKWNNYLCPDPRIPEHELVTRMREAAKKTEWKAPLTK